MRGLDFTLLIGLVVSLFLPLRIKCNCREEYTNGNYWRDGCRLTQVPTDIPAEAKKVYLRNNRISDIGSAAFSQLNNCSELRLSNNTLTRVKVADFMGLSSLKELVLQDNLISDIETGAFLPSGQCTRIWMKGNKLTQIKVDMFKGLRSLEKLVLADGDIHDIVTGAFTHINRCKVLMLTNNNLTHIRKGMFQGLESLEKLYLYENYITYIENGAFSILRNLIRLHLYSNKLTHIRASYFEGMSQLAKLSLSTNNISNIEPGSFTKLTSLRLLYLHKNELTTLKNNVFSNQYPVNITLLLGGNPLQCDSRMCWIKQGEEDGWITLNLILAHGSWSKPNCMNYPDRDWDDITLPCMKEGNCYLDQKKYINGTYRRDGCGLTQVPTNIPADAMKVYLSNNQISNIRTGVFSQLTNCSELWLNNNTLTHIKAADFVGLQSLKELTLENNFITEIKTAAFIHLEQCSYINIKGNRLIQINMNMFLYLPFLEKLSLSGNRINNIEPGTFAKLSKLMILDLSKNDISSIAPEMFTQQTSSRNDFQGNQLTTLERNTFHSQHFTNLTLLLFNNPLQCDSRLCWIKQAERDGWITLNFPLPDASWSEPNCANYPDVDWNNITLSCPMEGNPDGINHEFGAGKHKIYIAGGAAAALLLLCIIIVPILVKIRKVHRKRTSENKHEDTYFYARLLRHPSLSEPPTTQTPSPTPSQCRSQPNEYSASCDVTSIGTPQPRLSNPELDRPNSGYEVPSKYVLYPNQEEIYKDIEDNYDNYADTEVTQV